MLSLKFPLIKGILYFIDFLPEENYFKTSKITLGEAIAPSIFDRVHQWSNLRQFNVISPNTLYSCGFI